VVDSRNVVDDDGSGYSDGFWVESKFWCGERDWPFGLDGVSRTLLTRIVGSSIFRDTVLFFFSFLFVVFLLKFDFGDTSKMYLITK
jgi:hypothetical protein